MTLPEGTSIIFVQFQDGEPKVLLFLRDDDDGIPYPNCWDIPGGHVETGEMPEACIAREMMEEIGIDIGRPQLFRKYQMPDRIEHTYWQPCEFNIDDLQLNEGQAMRWFSEDEIKNLSDEDVAYGFRRVLFDFFHARPFAAERKHKE